MRSARTILSLFLIVLWILCDHRVVDDSWLEGVQEVQEPDTSPDGWILETTDSLGTRLGCDLAVGPP